jgi:hypothetical protein
LIGVSPAQTTISGNASDKFSSGTAAGGNPSGSTIDGTPIYLKVNGTWKKTNVTYATATNQKWLDWWKAVPDNTTDTAAWNAIPYSQVELSSYSRSDYTLLKAPDSTSYYKGDICNYINSAYRMPTGLELDSLRDAGYTSAHGGFTNAPADVPSTSDNDKAGKYAFTTNYGTLTGFVLPASGVRGNNTGSLYDEGRLGDHWSGSAESSSHAYELGFAGNYAIANKSFRNYGQPVRCVKIKNEN